MKWPEYPIAKVAERFISGGTPNTKNSELWSGAIPWITGADFNDGEAVIGRRFINEEAVEESATNIVPAGAILMVTRTGVGKIALAQEDTAISQDITGIVPGETVNAGYLIAAIRFRMERLLSVQRGATIKGITRDDVAKLPIPLPPPSEQRRIVEILDQADALRKKRAEADAKAQRILPALFYTMFGDPARNPMGWDTCALPYLAEKFSDGPFGSNLKTSHYKQSGVRVIRLQNIGVGVFSDRDKAFVSNNHFASLSKHRCVPGDVIIGTLGDPNLRACILPAHIPEALNKADCVQLRPNKKRATAEYVCWLLNIPETLQLASKMIQGQTRQRIAMGRLKELVVPRPPLDLQNEFSSRAQRMMTTLDRVTGQSRQIEKMYDSLLHRAFTGHLTARWREAHMRVLLQEMEQQAKLLEEVG